MYIYLGLLRYEISELKQEIRLVRGGGVFGKRGCDRTLRTLPSTVPAIDDNL